MQLGKYRREAIGAGTLCVFLVAERRHERVVPEKYGKWMTVYQRFRRWSEAGVWEAVASTLAGAMADNRHHSIDSTTVLVQIRRSRCMESEQD